MLARRYELYFLVARTISHSFAALTRVIYCFCHSNIKFISSRHRVISSIYYIKVSGIASGSKLITKGSCKLRVDAGGED